MCKAPRIYAFQLVNLRTLSDLSTKRKNTMLKTHPLPVQEEPNVGVVATLYWPMGNRSAHAYSKVNLRKYDVTCGPPPALSMHDGLGHRLDHPARLARRAHEHSDDRTTAHRCDSSRLRNDTGFIETWIAPAKALLDSMLYPESQTTGAVARSATLWRRDDVGMGLGCSGRRRETSRVAEHGVYHLSTLISSIFTVWRHTMNIS